MSPERISGVVLAGGRSSRFGRDKLAQPVGDATLLDRAVDVVAGLCAEVIVVIGADGPEPDLRRRPSTSIVRIVRDPESGRGPLLGLATGLEAAQCPIVVLAGGDMPALVPDVLRLLVDAVASGAGAAALADGDHRSPLPAAFDRVRGLAAARGALETGSANLAAVFAALDTVIVPESAWRVPDPEGRTLRDVDRPEDLAGAV